MWWIIAIVVLILFFVSAGFRKFAIALVAIAFIGGFIIHQNNKREEQLSRQRISLHQLIFENVNLKNTIIVTLILQVVFIMNQNNTL